MDAANWCIPSTAIQWFLSLLLLSILQSTRVSGQPGFISLNCGGTRNFTDRTGLSWMPDEGFISGGVSANTKTIISDEQYQTVRIFSKNQKKYCYTLPVNLGSRYLIRATFLYGNFDTSDIFPLFSISLDATIWATIKIENATQLYFQEMIISTQIRASVSVCIISGTVGTPFISTLELRQLQASMYAKDYDGTAYLKYGQRINFGALNSESIRYPDDQVDRIWESDIAKKGNGLTQEALGTLRINTTKNVTISKADEKPPLKVMQTAVVGSKGQLTYRLKLPNSGKAWAKSFLAEIEVLKSDETREFTFVVQNDTKYNGKPANLAQDFGPFTTHEPGFDTIDLPELVDFAFVKTSDSTLGPILNAMEVMLIIPIVEGTDAQDVSVLAAFKANPQSAASSLEGGDPCLPVPWDWVNCSSASTPRVTGIFLSSRNLTGTIPSSISEVQSLENLWLDNNDLNGSIPDLSPLVNLTILHLENNRLSGSIPQYFASLPHLKQLFVQNNHFSGEIPKSLLERSNIIFQYDGNPDLKVEKSESSHWRLIVGAVLGGAAVLITAFISLFFWLFRKRQRFPKEASGQKIKPALENPPASQTHLLPDISSVASTMEPGTVDTSHSFSFTELYEATENFSNKIGQGGFGPVYYGRLKDGTEIAAKVLSADSHQGTREFLNEVTLLSRIHHRNLVSLYGYCQEKNKMMLVYEYMHEGTLRDHLYGPAAKKKPLDWRMRLQLALDAAKGLEYLHTGCDPAIIHRDVKSSNILITNDMKAKVSDFGLSKDVEEGVSHVFSTVRGTVGYLDPEYYISQQLTEKSDVYSFGVVLLEVISGKEPISTEHFGADTNIVQWARSLIQKGDIEALVDPVLEGNYALEAAWKIAELAVLSVEPIGYSRPSISKIVQDLREAVSIGKTDQISVSDDGLETLSRLSGLSSTVTSHYHEYATSDLASSDSFIDTHLQPSVR